jgi:hypothetical protein
MHAKILFSMGDDFDILSHLKSSMFSNGALKCHTTKSKYGYQELLFDPK